MSKETFYKNPQKEYDEAVLEINKASKCIADIEKRCKTCSEDDKKTYEKFIIILNSDIVRYKEIKDRAYNDMKILGLV